MKRFVLLFALTLGTVFSLCAQNRVWFYLRTTTPKVIDATILNAKPKMASIANRKIGKVSLCQCAYDFKKAGETVEIEIEYTIESGSGKVWLGAHGCVLNTNPLKKSKYRIDSIIINDKEVLTEPRTAVGNTDFLQQAFKVEEGDMVKVKYKLVDIAEDK